MSQVDEILRAYGETIDYHGVDDGDITTAKQAILTLIEQAYFDGYKKGVADEIECVENSGEHLQLQGLSNKEKGGV